jgi:tRNA (guanine-N7-)-methyltransferase
MQPRSIKKYYRSLDPLMTPGLLIQQRDWTDIFGRSAPLELEIGHGNGEFLNRSSLERPQHDFVGLEIAWPSIKRALRRIGDPPRNNVRLICLPAAQALTYFFPEESISVARALFPVPWPKEAQAGKRLFSRGFMDLLASRLVPKGFFHMVTDNLILAEWTLKEASESSLPLALSEREGYLDTKYERKWEGGGQKLFYHLEGEKIRHPQITRPKALDMQPCYLNAKTLDPESYAPKGITGETSIIFRNLVFDQAKGEALLSVKVVENSFIQEFFIRITKQADGRWKLFPALSSQIFPTEGVRTALLLAANPGGPEAPRETPQKNQVDS